MIFLTSCPQTDGSSGGGNTRNAAPPAQTLPWSTHDLVVGVSCVFPPIPACEEKMLRLRESSGRLWRRA
jgi:hypothetical protein